MRKKFRQLFVISLIILAVITVMSSMLTSDEAVSIGLSVSSSIISIIIIVFCFSGFKKR